MSERSRDGLDRNLGQVDGLRIGALTGIGLVVAAAGWVLLLGMVVEANIPQARSGLRLSPALHGDLLEVARCIIISGFGLAVVGCLRSGFGALNRFFEAALQRSAQRQREATSEAGPELKQGGRPYRVLPDGSVEVDTILGSRRFRSMAEARDFI